MLLGDRNRIAAQLSDLKAQLDAAEDARAGLDMKLQKAQEELATARQGLQQAQENAALGLVIANENGQIIQADVLARRMLRLPQGDVTGMPIDGAYPDPNWAKTIDELLSQKANARRRAHMTLKEFEGIVDADLVSLTGLDGVPDGLVITLRTTESPAERQEAIVGLANEFRTPMTAITGYTDLLLGEQAGLLTEMQQQFLERVKANVERMGQLLNDLITTASPDSRPIELSPQFVNLIEIIEEAIIGLAARFRERKLAVQLDLPPELSLVRADRDSLYQIMLRLLSNAALCSKEGTQVIVRATQHGAKGEDGAYIRLAVIDTGGGIIPEDYPRVFRRFYRARQTLVQGMGETGIGMAIAKTLVEANGGRIWVESRVGFGSVFTFILPADGSK
jgi:signal transduction histidine kinase